MMKRILSCALTFLMLLALTAPAFADMIWEPDNSFYKKHQGECTYINRSYYANGPEGFVTLWDAPNGGVVEGQYQNGEILHVYHQYQDWGCITVFDEKQVSGWVPMAELELVYDYICFEEEYADKITKYNDEFVDYDGTAKVVNFYAYPGAEEVRHSWETSGQWNVLENLTGRTDGRSYISSIFVDEDGRTWGYVNYMYGHLNAWFCLDEPDGTGFPVREVSAPSLTPAQTPTLPAAGYVPYVLVAAVVAATGGLLGVFYGKKRKKPTE